MNVQGWDCGALLSWQDAQHLQHPTEAGSAPY